MQVTGEHPVKHDVRPLVVSKDVFANNLLVTFSLDLSGEEFQVVAVSLGLKHVSDKDPRVMEILRQLAVEWRRTALVCVVFVVVVFKNIWICTESKACAYVMHDMVYVDDCKYVCILIMKYLLVISFSASIASYVSCQTGRITYYEGLGL